MKIIKLSFLILVVGLASCSKGVQNPKCNETPPTDELCQAMFTCWFYDSKSNSCKEISYGGCSLKGFETKAECEECKCHSLTNEEYVTTSTVKE